MRFQVGHTSAIEPSDPTLMHKLLGEDVTRMVYDMIMSVVEDKAEYHTFATKVQAIATGVSYTSELADPKKVTDLIKEIPELAIVQVCLHPNPPTNSLSIRQNHLIDIKGRRPP